MNTGTRIPKDPDQISEERRPHPDTVLIRNGFDHKVRSVADISIRAHEYGAAGDRLQHLDRGTVPERCHHTLCKSRAPAVVRNTR